jgi:hypothetical protein
MSLCGKVFVVMATVGLALSSSAVASAQAGYSAIKPDGILGDGRTSVTYNPSTGEIGVDAPANAGLTSINIGSASRAFTGPGPKMNLGGDFDIWTAENVFKATFGSQFGSLSFGSLAASGLSEQFVLSDLTVDGSLAAGGGLGDVDLIYIPEPSAFVLSGFGLASLLVLVWRRHWTK